MPFRISERFGVWSAIGRRVLLLMPAMREEAEGGGFFAAMMNHDLWNSVEQILKDSSF